ncbi:Transthyretin-like family protein, partial [Oesophagostomum dentatum]
LVFNSPSISVPIKLAEARPSVTGDFAISWSGTDFIPIAPVVNIYHRCMFPQPMKLCARVLSMEVPNSYVATSSSRVNATYDIGTANLNIKYSFEMVDCIFGAYS